MALVCLGVISIFKCKRHYKSRDIGESCTERTEPPQKMMIGELSLPLGEFMFVVFFMYIKVTNCFISVRHASDCW